MQRRLSAVLSALVLAIGLVFVPAAPAQAAFIWQGDFTISSGGLCMGVSGNSSANGALIYPQNCSFGAEIQKWRIYRLDDQNNYMFQSFKYAAQNKCLDGPDSDPRIVHLWGCHGGNQQRFYLSPTATGPQQIRQAGGNECLGVVLGPLTYSLQQLNCSASTPPMLILTRVA
ncbi:ricin-type beta-trefoil lectin domain protein [Phytomonospora endophytica]|uniref:Ricin B lectin domain-containing protein n=1 Tax=Phytomonospora endophytica TaxID=714109 RepID=A0A841FW92_9ACTN|nr:ricin-type beta-trefoil lectin domain protein [Phytomonospora endophytica]MBB6039023.1 hypothetical protein [Phytomonospora endophytica]GIG69501.1 hypothetical protein Pen01_57960 [Phytomonospora endophytica]